MFHLNSTKPRDLSTFEDLARSSRRTDAIDPETIGFYKTTPKSTYLGISIGPDVLKRAGLKIGDKVSVLRNGREFAIVRGGSRNIEKNANQGRVCLPPIFLIPEVCRVTPEYEGGVIYFTAPESAKPNLKYMREE